MGVFVGGVRMSDTTFITNKDTDTLENHFKTLMKNTKSFDCLVGYFFASGFFKIYKELEGVEKIRILVGISTNQKTVDMLSSAKDDQITLKDSVSELKKELENQIVKEYEDSKDIFDVEEGTKKFIEWINSGKLEIRASPNQDMHGKIYIFTSKGGGFGDEGRIITGSSNLTDAGLNRKNEINKVEKRKEDYDWALNFFNELWETSVEVSDRYIQTIKTKTWMNDEISPYHLFLKFIYEYLKERIDEDLEQLGENGYKPENFMNLKYQIDAVNDAKKKLLEYGGVFLSDVVGLGKTYIATMLAKELEFEDGSASGTLVIAPPVLLDEDNPGSWNRAFWDFGIRRVKFCSRGMLDKLTKEDTEKYKTVIIDEAHGFRNEATGRYEDMFRICKGKRVILVSATPLNNTPMDLLSQIKLFQTSRKSTLPNPEVRDLEAFFKKLQFRLKGLDRLEDKDEYFQIIKENANEIREKILKYLMVRRTRSSIEKYYGDDLKQQKLKFPEVVDPEPIIYRFDKELDKIFNKTLDMITNKDKFSYARYTPLLYLKNQKILSNLEKGSQRNMGAFMKGVLLKRLESSFFAFKKTIDRFIASHENFIEAYDKGKVYLSKKYINKILGYLDSEDFESIQGLIDSEKAKEYVSGDFSNKFIEDLNSDLKTLKEIQIMWKDINYDPKLEEFERRLSKDPILKKSKVIVFTESRETAEYLEKELSSSLKSRVRAFSSHSDDSLRKEIIENFDVRKGKKDTISLLITTDILSEGINLHNSNVVMNYDIPWNPTKMMQRVGRINRVDSKHDKIYTYNFFPAGPINDPLKLKEAAEYKINAFIEMLGNDAKILTDEEIKSHDLFVKLNSKKILIGDEHESEDVELKYLTKLRKIRDEDKVLYNKIILLPKKSRTSRKISEKNDSVITFFKKGNLRKIFITDKNLVPEELDLAKAVKIFECNKEIKPHNLDKVFYDYLEKNKEAFDSVFDIEETDISGKGRSNDFRLVKKVKAIWGNSEFTDENKDYLKDIVQLLIDGGMAKPTVKKTWKVVKDETNPIKILAKIKMNVPEEYFKKNPVNSADMSGPKEVILSEYLVN